ncbi:hypothetical protein EXIGLDRAFT_761050 [Exidia glandulosa HHB12029]|uniref:MYND-type domain-containing protein n=1 Tax=Exidia glandulosa HHB12029 TaxID=1314781 RepID=A0A165NPG2_EXIGL|nr:hypothetical protein EXIGLDRAFT_761050 [Exidia glandulosa HHB12029]
MEREAKRLARTLRPPLRWTVCPRCLTAFLNITPVTVENAPILRAKCGAFCSALMGWVTDQRSTSISSRLALSTQLMQNSLNCPRCADPPLDTRCAPRLAILQKAIQDDYDKSSSNDTTFFDELLSFSISFLVDLLAGLDSYSSRGKTFGSRRGLWPATPDELFPNGPAQTISTLCAWYNQRRGTEIASVLYYLLHLHRPLTLKNLNLERNRRLLLDTFNEVYQAYTIHLDAASRPSDERTARPIIGANPKTGVHFTNRLLIAISVGQDYDWGDLPAFMTDRAPELYRHMFPVIQHLDSISDPNLPHRIHSLMWRLYLLLPGPSTADLDEADPDYPFFLKRSNEWVDEIQADPFRDLHRWIPWDLRNCSGPGCRASVLESATGRPFARCARCKMVQYCSRECQRRDWNSDDVVHPHKALCPALQEVVVFSQPWMSVDDFVSARRDHCFPVERAKMISNWQQDARAGITLRGKPPAHHEAAVHVEEESATDCDSSAVS